MLDYLISDTENPHPLVIVGATDRTRLMTIVCFISRWQKEKMEKHPFAITEMEIGPFGMSDVEDR